MDYIQFQSIERKERNPESSCHGAESPVESGLPAGYTNCEADDVISHQATSSNEETTAEQCYDLSSCKRYGLVAAVLVVAAVGRGERNLITPFYQNYAVQRNVSEVGIGVVFGGFDFVCWGSCMLWARVLHCAPVKYVYVAGIVGTSTSSALFIVLYFIHSAHAFLATSIAIRMLMGFFTGASLVAENALMISMFPDNVASVCGWLEAAGAIGVMSGPVIGGVLYQYGGFFAPFAVTSAFILSVGLSLFVAFPSAATSKTAAEPMPSSCTMVANPVFTSCLSFTFTLMGLIAMVMSLFSLRLESYGLNAFQRSWVISVATLFYTLFSVLAGWVVDHRPRWTVPLIISGFSVLSIVVTAFGPAPYYHMHNHPLWLLVACWAMVGVAGPIGILPAISLAYSTTKAAGFPDSQEVYGMVAGYIKSSESLGSGLTSVVGGIVYDAVGWQWLMTAMAFVFALQVATFTLLMLRNAQCKGRHLAAAASALYNDQEEETVPIQTVLARYH